MSRFDVRFKCLSWPNVRSQTAINESIGLSHTSGDGKIPFDLTELYEGRVCDDDYRRQNERHCESWTTPIGRSEVGWNNQFMRPVNRHELCTDPNSYIGNELYRNYIFADWDLTKRLVPGEFNDDHFSTTGP